MPANAEFRILGPEGPCTIELMPGADFEDLQTAIRLQTGCAQLAQRLKYGDRVLRKVGDRLLGVDLDQVVLDLGAGEAVELHLDYLDPKQVQALQDLAKCGPGERGDWLANQPTAVREDIDVVCAVVALEGKALQYAAKDAQRNFEAVLTAVSQYGPALKYAARRMRANRDVAIAAVSQDGQALCLVAEELLSDREVVLAAVTQNGRALASADLLMRSSKEVVLVAVQQCGTALEFASEELRSDPEVIAAAIDRDMRANEYIANEEARGHRIVALATMGHDGYCLENFPGCFDDYEVVLKAVTQNGCALEFADPDLQEDRELVLAAVSQVGYALEHASEELTADREIALVAVRQIGTALEYVAPCLKSDREVVLAAVNQVGDALEYADESLQDDREIVFVAVSGLGDALAFASDALKADREVVLAAVSQSGEALEHASEDLRADKQVVMRAVLTSGHALQFATEEMCENREVVVAAVQQAGFDALFYAAQELRDDEELLLTAVEQAERAPDFDADEFNRRLSKLDHRMSMTIETARSRRSFLSGRASRSGSYRDVSPMNSVMQTYSSRGGQMHTFDEGDEDGYDRSEALDAVVRNASDLQLLGAAFQADHEIVMAAVESNGLLLAFASEELRNDREIVLAAVTQCGVALQYASDELRGDQEVVLTAMAESDEAMDFADPACLDGIAFEGSKMLTRPPTPPPTGDSPKSPFSSEGDRWRSLEAKGKGKSKGAGAKNRERRDSSPLTPKIFGDWSWPPNRPGADGDLGKKGGKGSKDKLAAGKGQSSVVGMRESKKASKYASEPGVDSDLLSSDGRGAHLHASRLVLPENRSSTSLATNHTLVTSHTDEGGYPLLPGASFGSLGTGSTRGSRLIPRQEIAAVLGRRDSSRSERRDSRAVQRDRSVSRDRSVGREPSDVVRVRKGIEDGRSGLSTGGKGKRKADQFRSSP